MIRRGKVKNRSSVKHVTVHGKYRYLMPLDREMADRVNALAKPYPKKSAGSLMAEQRATSPDCGGSIPTPALQFAGAGV